MGRDDTYGEPKAICKKGLGPRTRRKCAVEKNICVGRRQCVRLTWGYVHIKRIACDNSGPTKTVVLKKKKKKK